MNWADESDSATGDEGYPEADAGMDDAAYDVAGGDDEVTGFDAEDESLAADAEVSDDGDDAEAGDDGTEPVAEDGGEDPGAEETDDAAFDEPQQSASDAEAESDPDAEAIEITDDEVVGTDPDADLAADDPAFDAEFPPDIDMDARPEPVDGAPWSDASLLGSDGDAGTDWAAYDYSAPPMDDLFAMDGASSGSWDSLTASDDPAVSSLARWWQPT